MNKEGLRNYLLLQARDLGFFAVGISKVRFLENEARLLEEWLKMGYHGEMSYMENHFDKRTDPSKLVPGARTVVSLCYNYYSERPESKDGSFKIARYALGEDYHKVLKDKLGELLSRIEAKTGIIEGRCFVDSAPVMERDWAKYSGLGWIGKNTLLLNKKKGSYFFLAQIISDLDLDEDSPMRDHCGTCTRCIDLCPTSAISPQGYLLDASRCISYLTIELRKDIPTEFKGLMNDWIFGCDICQEVCPWNRFAKKHNEPKFEATDTLRNMNKKDWIELTEEVFYQVFKNSALRRTKWKGLQRNIGFLTDGESVLPSTNNQ